MCDEDFEARQSQKGSELPSESNAVLVQEPLVEPKSELKAEASISLPLEEYSSLLEMTNKVVKPNLEETA